MDQTQSCDQSIRTSHPFNKSADKNIGLNRLLTLDATLTAGWLELTHELPLDTDILTEHRVGQSSRESNCSSNLPPKQQRKLRNGKSLSSAKTPDSEPFLMPLRSRQMVLPLRCAADLHYCSAQN